jgi:hypothetical protein
VAQNLIAEVSKASGNAKESMALTHKQNTHTHTHTTLLAREIRGRELVVWRRVEGHVMCRARRWWCLRRVNAMSDTHTEEERINKKI